MRPSRFLWRGQWAVPALVACVVLAGTSCQSEPRGLEEGPGRFGDGGGSLDPECDRILCSPDLTKIIRRCEGVVTVIETCGDGLACGEGRCVEACKSAELALGSVGCDFAAIPPEDRAYNMGDCFAAVIANTWRGPVSLSADLGGEPIDISQSVYTAQKAGEGVAYTRVEGPLKEGEVAIVFLSNRVTVPASGFLCPPGVVPAYAGDPLRHGTGVTRAFRLKTDRPVSAYAIFPYGGASTHYPTATLLLPISSWAKNYRTISPAGFRASDRFEWTQIGSRVVQIVASEDDTEVKMKPTVAVNPGYRVDAVAPGGVATWKLNRGEVVQLLQMKDLVGSVIEATKPVGLFGGQECSFVPADRPACDILHQQIAPLSRWGFEYALVPPPPRKGSTVGDAMVPVPWSFVGAVDGTVLSYDPARPEGAPETLSAGERAAFMTDSIVSVRSQDAEHPFHVSVYMTGQSYGGLGDADFVTVVPSDQYLSRYIFFADFTFADTALTLVRRRGSRGFDPVTVDCAGEVIDWRPLGVRGEYEYTWLSLTKHHREATFGSRACGYGRHSAESDGAFAVTVWGMDLWASYGYAGGASVRPVSHVYVPVH